MISAPPLPEESRYRRLFDCAEDGILILDADTRRITDANPRLLRWIGLEAGEIIGRTFDALGPPDNAASARTAFAELLRSGHIRCEHLPLLAKDGRLIEVEIVGGLREEEGRRVIQLGLRDITSRKQADSESRRTREELARYTIELETTVQLRTAELRLSNAQLETFVYSIAHDLKAPLRTMQGFSRLLLEEHAQGLGGRGREYAGFIDSAARTMDHLLADLLAFSRVTQEKMDLGPVSLETAVRNALGACEEQISASGAVLEVVPPFPEVLAHPATLRQVISHLVGNAVKFVGKEPPRVRIRAEERPDNVVRLWVEDNGIGIPPEFHDQIFGVFKRLHTTAYVGTGIGHAEVQKGKLRKGGRVGLVSEPGSGSRFWIELARPASGKRPA